MIYRAFKRLTFKDADLNRIQDNIEASLQPFFNLAILDGILFPNQVISTTDTIIQHKLFRTFKGWIITRKSGAADVYESTTNTNPAAFLILKASSQVTCDLWIF